LRSFSPEVLDAAYKAATQFYAEESGKNPAFKKLYDAMLPYQKTQNQWFSVAELRMDQFRQQHIR
jgi:TRAP-type mannitol/chloroaromatic compound transport system substrate-binding protein